MSAIINKYRRAYKTLGNLADKLGFLLQLLEEYSERSAMAFDYSVPWTDKEEIEVSDLGEFIISELSRLREELIDDTESPPMKN